MTSFTFVLPNAAVISYSRKLTNSKHSHTRFNANTPSQIFVSFYIFLGVALTSWAANVNLQADLAWMYEEYKESLAAVESDIKVRIRHTVRDRAVVLTWNEASK